jgi:probable non-F420 flavinoid oxidoreductase
MTRFGYHASHEQHPPSVLLRYVQLAEQAGFQGVLAADHFHPWLEENGHSGYVWSWLGAALHATSSMTFGTVNAPGDRYHPAIIAQAAATLAGMFPGRFWFAVGSGEAVNEHVTGRAWPDKAGRNARLAECANVMRALWRGETITHHGLIDVVDARLYSLPDAPPELLGAAVTPETAEWCASWADGVITTGKPRAEMDRFLDAFRRGGGEGKRVAVQHVLSWAPSEQDARAAAHREWRFAALDGETIWNLRTPADFARATRKVSVDQVVEKVPTSASVEKHLGDLRAYRELGVDDVYVFNVGRNQEEFIEVFGRALPALR